MSVASVWEIAIKAGLGQLQVPPGLRGYLRRQLVCNEFELLPVLFEHAVAVRDLPRHHRDPFDRLLIAQARVEQLSLVSRDPHESLRIRGALVGCASAFARTPQRFASG